MKKKFIWMVLGLGFFAFVYLNNNSLLVKPPAGKPILLAHRGLGQTFSMEGITNETNTAERIYPPEHPFLENTLPSMAEAFKDRADIVELDIHPTLDGQFAVFHDWTLNGRTNGTGTTRDHTMAQLKTLDIGYGYTADNGKTFPFRGKGVGLMPSLDEVMTCFPDKSFLIHVKSDDPMEGKLLAGFLSKFPTKRLRELAVYGGDKPIATLHQSLPRLRVMSKATLMKSLLSYMAIGWTGYVPASCRNTEIHLPVKYAHWLWGWPNRFLKRMAAVNTRVILVMGNGDFSSGFDTAQDLKQLPPGYSGGIWTNRIDRIGPLIRKEETKQ